MTTKQLTEYRQQVNRMRKKGYYLDKVLTAKEYGKLSKSQKATYDKKAKKLMSGDVTFSKIGNVFVEKSKANKIRKKLKEREKLNNDIMNMTISKGYKKAFKMSEKWKYAIITIDEKNIKTIEDVETELMRKSGIEELKEFQDDFIKSIEEIKNKAFISEAVMIYDLFIRHMKGMNPIDFYKWYFENQKYIQGIHSWLEYYEESDKDDPYAYNGIYSIEMQNIDNMSRTMN